MTVLVTGGARSGKSTFAEQFALRSGAPYGIYIATSQAWDEEMEERIAAHRQMRESSGFEWTTIEEPLDLTKRLSMIERSLNNAAQSRLKQPVVLIDCLTLWISNWLLKFEDEELNGNQTSKLAQLIEELVDTVRNYPYPIIMVTNEVGSGVVPAYPLGRKFRDAAGTMNQMISAACERVFLVTAGIPVDLKAIAFRWNEEK